MAQQKAFKENSRTTNYWVPENPDRRTGHNEYRFLIKQKFQSPKKPPLREIHLRVEGNPELYPNESALKTQAHITQRANRSKTCITPNYTEFSDKCEVDCYHNNLHSWGNRKSTQITTLFIKFFKLKAPAEHTPKNKTEASISHATSRITHITYHAYQRQQELPLSATI